MFLHMAWGEGSRIGGWGESGWGQERERGGRGGEKVKTRSRFIKLRLPAQKLFSELSSVPHGQLPLRGASVAGHPSLKSKHQVRATRCMIEFGSQSRGVRERLAL